MFSLFAPQCCFQNTGPLSPIREVASTEGPHHPFTTFINIQDPVPPETSAVCSVFLSSTFLGDDRGDFTVHVHLISWCWKPSDMLTTMNIYLSASSATWPLWPNLGPKQQSEWPHFQNPKLRVSQCKLQSLYLLPLRPPIIYQPLWWNNSNWVPYKSMLNKPRGLLWLFSNPFIHLLLNLKHDSHMIWLLQIFSIPKTSDPPHFLSLIWTDDLAFKFTKNVKVFLLIFFHSFLPYRLSKTTSKNVPLLPPVFFSIFLVSEKMCPPSLGQALLKELPLQSPQQLAPLSSESSIFLPLVNLSLSYKLAHTFPRF